MLARNKKVASKKQINFVNANCARRPNEQVAIGLNMICIINQYHFVQAKMNQHRLSQLFYIGNSQIAQLETNQSEQEMESPIDRFCQCLKSVCQILCKPGDEDRVSQIQKKLSDYDSNFHGSPGQFLQKHLSSNLAILNSTKLHDTKDLRDRILFYEFLIYQNMNDKKPVQTIDGSYDVISYMLRDDVNVQRDLCKFIHSYAEFSIRFVYDSDFQRLGETNLNNPGSQNFLHQKEQIPYSTYNLRYPKLNIVRQNFFLYFLRENRLRGTDDVADLRDKSESMLIMEPPPRLEVLFQQAKILTTKIIKNKRNGILELYIGFLQFYKNIKGGQVKCPNSIEALLEQGIETSSLILIPNKSFWRLTMNNSIYINLTMILSKIQQTRKKFNQQQSLRDLIQASMCLSLLHELMHVLLRKCSLVQKFNKSFELHEQKPYQTKKHSRAGFSEFFQSLDISMLKHISHNKDKIYRKINRQQVANQVQEIKKQILCYQLGRLEQKLRVSLCSKKQISSAKIKLQTISEEQFIQYLKNIKIPELQLILVQPGNDSQFDSELFFINQCLKYLEKQNKEIQERFQIRAEVYPQNVQQHIWSLKKKIFKTQIPDLVDEISLQLKSPFLNAVKKESGWMIQSGIFRTFAKTNKIYPKDYKILKDLVTIEDEWQSYNIRLKFGKKQQNCEEPAIICYRMSSNHDYLDMQGCRCPT